MGTYSDPVALIRGAQTFADIQMVFLDAFGILAPKWEHDFERGAQVKGWLTRAESADNPIDRWVFADTVRSSVVHDQALAVVGLGDYKQLVERANRLLPDAKAQVGKLVHDLYVEAATAKIDPDAMNDALAKLEELDGHDRVIEISIAPREGAIGDKRSAEIVELREKKGWRQLKANFDAIEKNWHTLHDQVGEKYASGEFTEHDYEVWCEKLAAEYEKNIKPVRNKVEALEKEVDAIKALWNAEAQKVRADAHQEIENNKRKREEIHAQLRAAVVDKILETSPITQEAADAWAEGQSFNDAARNRLKKLAYPIQDFKRDMAEFYRLTGGRVGKVTIMSTGRRRACAMVDAGEVHLDGNFTKVTLFHEMGHLLERYPHFKKSANNFIHERIKSDTPVKPLRTMTGNRGYRTDERAYEDGFFHPYVGKVYPDGLTEVWSMGLQMFASPKDMALLYDKDPGMFAMIAGMMVTPPSAYEQESSQHRAKFAAKRLSDQEEIKKFYNQLTRLSKNVETLIEGSHYSIFGYGPGYTKKLNRFVVKYKGEALHYSMFTSAKDARNFLYLFLWMRESRGLDAAKSSGSNLFEAIKILVVPAELITGGTADKGKPFAVKKDVKVLPEDRLSAEDQEYIQEAGAFMQWLEKRGFDNRIYQNEHEAVLYRHGFARISLSLQSSRRQAEFVALGKDRWFDHFTESGGAGLKAGEFFATLRRHVQELEEEFKNVSSA